MQLMYTSQPCATRVHKLIMCNSCTQANHVQLITQANHVKQIKQANHVHKFAMTTHVHTGVISRS